MGLPSEIVSDNDHLITSKFFMTMCQLAGVHQHQSIIYRLKGNIRAKRAVQAIINMMRKTLVANQETLWIHILPWCVYTINTLPGIQQDLSPYEIIYGRPPITIGDRFHDEIMESSLHANAQQWFHQVLRIREEAQRRLTELHDKLRHKSMEESKIHEYEPGDHVWIRARAGTNN